MNIANILNNELLKQTFTEEEEPLVCLERCRQMASMYARIENSIAVLSDMKSNTSYIYYGKVASELGLSDPNRSGMIHSIWEEEIFTRIHPDDLPGKHLLELQFFHFLKNVPDRERTDYYIASHIRMRNLSGEYLPVQHRMFYVASHSNGSIWLALCLYNFSVDATLTSVIINSANGRVIKPEKQDCDDMLSDREKEILRLIDQGQMSKEIAQTLSISIHTVNRHRQNILEKLHVGNSIEACRVAKGLDLLS